MSDNVKKDRDTGKNHGTNAGDEGEVELRMSGETAGSHEDSDDSNRPTADFTLSKEEASSFLDAIRKYSETYVSKEEKCLEAVQKISPAESFVLSAEKQSAKLFSGWKQQVHIVKTLYDDYHIAVREI